MPPIVNLKLVQRSTRWLVGILVIILILFGVYLIILQLHRLSGISPNHLSALQKTIIGKPLDNSVTQLPGLKQKSAKGGQIDYTYISPLLYRPNQITTQNNIVTFERIVTPVDSTAKGFAHISAYTDALGAPEDKVIGSKVYGSYVVTYIYASKGVAIVGNPNTDTVFEIQRFSPTSVSDYKQKYGQDLAPNAGVGGG